MTGAAVLAVAVFPFVRLGPGKIESKGARIRSIIGSAFRFFLNVCTRLGLMLPLRVHGLEQVRAAGSCIIVANHPTLIDIVALGSLVENFNCVVKHKLRYDPFLGGCIKAAGFVRNDRPQELMRRCLTGLSNGQPLIIFPEGSRSPEAGLRSFSRGAAHLALRSGAPVVSAVLTCRPAVLMKHQRWFSIPMEPCQFTISFQLQGRFTASSAGADGDQTFSTQARALTGQFEDFFRSQLHHPKKASQSCAQECGPAIASVSSIKESSANSHSNERHRSAILIPNHNHKSEISSLLDRLASAGIPCLIVDDGSEPGTRQVLEEQAAKRREWVTLLRRPSQGGKGAAVMDGLKFLHAAGFTHALQIDADGQHNTDDLAKFLLLSRENPDALVLGKPLYDADAPKIRQAGRQLSRMLVWAETRSFDIADPLLGYRVYPLNVAVDLIDGCRMGTTMDFDPEIAVRMKWRGVPIRNIRTRVSYPAGGFSNFRMFADNLGMVKLHVRLLGEMVLRFAQGARPKS